LYNIEELQRIIEKEFNEAWEEGTLPGWPKEEMEEDDNDLFCVACKKITILYQIIIKKLILILFFNRNR